MKSAKDALQQELSGCVRVKDTIEVPELIMWALWVVLRRLNEKKELK